MKAMLMISMALLAAGCAADIQHDGVRTDHQYRRENGRIEAAERFQRLTRLCVLAGGVVYTSRRSSGRFPPTASEMNGATCGDNPAQVL